MGTLPQLEYAIYVTPVPYMSLEQAAYETYAVTYMNNV